MLKAMLLYRNVKFACGTLGGVAVVASQAIWAQAYPSKPLRVLVASVAGGPPDLIMRGFSEPLRQEFGQPIVIENQPAGDGIVAAQMVTRGNTDGHTLIMASAGPIFQDAITIG